MRCWKSILAATLLQILGAGAFAQDRPLIEPLWIGYVQAESFAEAMRFSTSLQQALRRKRFTPVWQPFGDGLAAARALDAGDIDIALNIPLGDMVAAKRENLKMVFIAELRSIAPSCCDQEQVFADHMLKRYTLSAAYFADCREDALLVLHQEINKVLQQDPGHSAPALENPGSMRVAQRPSLEPIDQSHRHH